MRKTFLLTFVVVLGLLEAPGLPASTAPVVWTISSMARALPTDTPGTLIAPHLYAARSENEAFQIVVRAPAAGMTLESVTASDLAAGGGITISNSNVTLYREYYVNVSPASPGHGGTNQSLGAGTYPDALIPFLNPDTGAPLTGGTYQAVPYTMSASGTTAIWVDMWVPPGTPPGDYSGTVTLNTNQGDLTVPWTLTVWDFTLPLQPTLKSSFAFWNSVGEDALEGLIRHKIMPGKISIPNTAAAEKTLATSVGLNGVNTGLWSGADASNCVMTPAPSVSSFLNAAARQASGLYLFNYTADEVQSCANIFPTIQQWAQNMHQAGIENLVVIPPTPALYDDGSGTGRSAVDIWVELPVQYNAATVAQVQAKGNEVWSYNALVQDNYSPKWEIDYAPIDYRIQAGFLSQSLGFTGLLYWRVDLWTVDPWTSVNNSGQLASGNYPGEGMLVYPGQDVNYSGVVPSIRLKQLREGIEDYEYVAILKTLGRGSWALSLVNTIAQNWQNWTQNPDALEAVRRQLGEEIDQMARTNFIAPPPLGKR